jgi:cytochrome c biogenesis protein CcmG, thiol:disulfide interchange protein DsbE
VTTRRRRKERVGQSSPAGRSTQSRAPAARGERPAASGKQGRTAVAGKAAARRKLRAAVISVAVLILITAGVLAFRGGSPTAGTVTNPAAFSLPALNGNGWVRLARYRGKPVVVNFFASWCTECQAELPGFRQEAIALKGKVTFIGVDSLETGDKNFLPSLFHLAGAFAALARDAGPDGNGLHAALGGGNTMPLTAFYGADGRLLDVERGALVPAAALKIKIAQLFGVTS